MSDIGDIGDIERERRAAHEGALIQPAPLLGTIVVTGADRRSWLNGLITCELAKLEPGGGAYGLSVAKSGKILAELWIVALEDRLLVGALRDRVPMLLEHFNRYIMMEDAEVADASGELGWLFVHGPLSGDLVLVARGSGAHAAGVAFTDLGGAAVVAKESALEGVMNALLTHAGERGVLASPEAFERLRVEEGIAKFGVDYTDQNYPQEASLERLAVSFQKGCYLGQETVFMLEARGHAKKRLVSLEVQGAGEVPPDAPITLPGDGAEVGTITSRAPAPGKEGVVALGYVKYKHAATGTELLVAGRPARITRAPAPKS
jgi:tRNA-modifying protein YgfZ